MSEENKEIETQIPATISFFVNGTTVQIQFADGLHEIPPHIVNYLGQTALETLAPALREKDFADFLAGFNQKTQKDNLNNFQKQFVYNHFGQKF